MLFRVQFYLAPSAFDEFVVSPKIPHDASLYPFESLLILQRKLLAKYWNVHPIGTHHFRDDASWRLGDELSGCDDGPRPIHPHHWLLLNLLLHRLNPMVAVWNWT